VGIVASTLFMRSTMTDRLKAFTMLFADALRPIEQAKIDCGREHFKAIAVQENPARYVVKRSVEELMTESQ